MGPVARPVHPDLVPRGAVRRGGPRPAPTRSTRGDEPGGTDHPTWGWKPRPLLALPSGGTANRWRQGEERRGNPRPRVVAVWDGRLVKNQAAVLLFGEW